MKQKKVPARMCVSCGEMKEKKILFRVVRSPEGDVSIDTAGKASGRGAYLCKSADCVAAAKKRRIIERNLNVTGCESIYESLRLLCEENGQ